jgi:hypothetical protein
VYIGLINPHRASPPLTILSRQTARKWRAIPGESGCQRATSQTDDISVENSFLNLALGCERVDEVGDEASLSEV